LFGADDAENRIGVAGGALNIFLAIVQPSVDKNLELASPSWCWDEA